MSLRSRGQEVRIQLIVDGQLLAGSFSKIENFKLTPRADLTDSSFLGEVADSSDVMMHGWDVSWTMHEQDSSAFDVWNSIVGTLNAGIQQPTINVVVIKTYRDPGVLPVVLTLEKCVLKMDSNDFGSRKDYVKATFSGKCQSVRKR